jgi:hypothetical protein
MEYAIAEDLKEVMEKDTKIHAMWIGGSVAEGYNDIDIWMDIDDGQDEAVFASIEQFLKSKGEIDINFGENMSPPFTHRVYHLAHTDPYHFIEVTLHAHSHEFGLFDRMRKIKLLFDKDGTTTFKPFDEVSYNDMLQERKKFLTEKIGLGEQSVIKEITRKQFMDAMHNYQFWLLDPLIELIRIKYAPLKVTYGLKHGSRDLPKDIVAEIESLYMIKSLEDFSGKIENVKAMVKKYS